MTMKWLLFLFHILRVSAAKQLRGWYTDSTKKHAITTSLHMLSSISFTVSQSLNTTYMMYEAEKRTVLYKPRLSVKGHRNRTLTMTASCECGMRQAVCFFTRRELGQDSWYSDLLLASQSRVRILPGARDFLFYKTVQTSSGIYPASFSICIGILSWW